METLNLGKVSITPKGSWTSSVYERLDVVTHNNATFLSLENGNVDEPSESSAKWMKIAEKGDTGEQGIQGLKGDNGDKGDKGDSVTVIQAANQSEAIALSLENPQNIYFWV